MPRDRLSVTSAYVRPPRHFVELLCAAVARGVDVEVLVPGPHTDPVIHRWAAEPHFEELLERGVRVWVYQPTMQHGKVMTVDGAVALVGTTNFDARSLALNEQVGLLLHDRALTATLDGHFDDDRTSSVAVDLNVWRQRGQLERSRQVVAHLATFGIRGAGASRRDGLSRARESGFDQRGEDAGPAS
ncbi:MAG TPA: phospholipase D-like domain-containing protein [Egibacteraceae bacterium]|nr:phospholipase D-like domain-containing protein [Egibacteraceae bacterium]